jgi:hypothetical protein
MGLGPPSKKAVGKLLQTPIYSLFTPFYKAIDNALCYTCAIPRGIEERL